MRCRPASLADRGAVSFCELAEHPFVPSTGGCGALATAAWSQGARTAFDAREMSAVLEMVGPGLGVSVLSAVGLPTGWRPDR